MPRGKLELTWVGKDERTRLEPRVLVEDPAKSYGDPNSENMLIYGDNLLALKALEQDFAGRIKCIYIDPPYNTGSAFAQYDDGLEHSIWLRMMRDRLEVMSKLLAQDGSVWVHLDDNEVHYCKVLMDEILGRAQFVATVVWQKTYSVRSNAEYFSTSHEYILVYCKERGRFVLNKMERSPSQLSRFKNPDSDPRGPWQSVTMTISLMGGARGRLYARTGHSENIYEITAPDGRRVLPPAGRCWSRSRSGFEALSNDGRIYWGETGASVPRMKVFLSELQGGVIPTTLWADSETYGYNQHAVREVRGLLLGEEFPTPKPERLISQVLMTGSGPGDIVLDSFLGSGTTAAVAHKMGRTWIGVEMGNQADSLCQPRMKKVVDGTDQGGISKAVGWKGGGGFKYYRLAETLLVQDKDLSAKGHPVYVINPKYDEKMLIRAICKIEGFRYRNEGRLHGISSENRFLHVTTQLLTQVYLDSLVQDISLEQSLLVYCTRRSRSLAMPDNIEVKKIPRDLLAKCDYQEDVG